MFTFKLYTAKDTTTPANCVPDISSALLMAEHFLPNYSKVEVLLNAKVVVKTLTNDNPIISASFNAGA